MANYDNSRYTYSQVYSGTGYFKMDDALRYSAGVLELQRKMNEVGFWCGVADGIFGKRTDLAVRHFQREYTGVVDGCAGPNTLVQLELKYALNPHFSVTPGSYGVYFDSNTKKFMYCQQVVYNKLKAAGFSNIVIAGFMGNFEAESPYFYTLCPSSGAQGIAQWTVSSRKTNLQNYVNAIHENKENIIVQAQFVLQEITVGGNYALYNANTIVNYLGNSSLMASTQIAADYITALYEGCENFSTWSQVQSCGHASRYTQNPTNAYDGKYYIDAAKRRGYAASYYNCICAM